MIRVPSAPAYLAAALRDRFDELAPDLVKMGVLTRLDVDALAKYIVAEHVYLRVSDMMDGGVSTDRLLYVPEDIYPSISRYIINKADVFITVAGTIGRVGKIPDELDGANLTENADRLVLAGVNQDWLIKVLQSGMIQEQIAEATTQVGQPKLAIARIERFLIPLPPLAEQHRIVQRIEELLPLVKGL